jgi:hypothetical protein
VQNSPSADRCTGTHRKAKILAGTLPEIGLFYGLDSRKNAWHSAGIGHRTATWKLPQRGHRD